MVVPLQRSPFRPLIVVIWSYGTAPARTRHRLHPLRRTATRKHEIWSQTGVGFVEIRNDVCRIVSEEFGIWYCLGVIKTHLLLMISPRGTASLYNMTRSVSTDCKALRCCPGYFMSFSIEPWSLMNVFLWDYITEKQSRWRWRGHGLVTSLRILGQHARAFDKYQTNNGLYLLIFPHNLIFNRPCPSPLTTVPPYPPIGST